MGWMYSHKPAGQSDLDWIRAELPETFKRVDAVRKIGRALYAVYRVPDDYASTQTTFEPCADGAIRSMLVILIGHDRGYHNTGYKDMDESMGPCEATCPPALLDMLSPIRDGADTFARDWRERCRAHNATAKAKSVTLEEGATIELERSPAWTDGYRGLRYKVEKMRTRSRNTRKTTLLRALDTGSLYRVPSDLSAYLPKSVTA